MTTRRAVLWLLALGVALQVLTAGIGSLYNETDGQYAGAAKVMARGGNWLVPENNGEPRLVKPPLLYWMMAASFRAFGVNEFAARLPNALGILAWMLATFAIGSRLAGVRHGFTAGVVLLTLLGTSTLGRIVMPEPVFCAFITWAVYAGIRAMEGGSRWAVAMWGFAALAAFTKGLHGLLYPLATLLIAVAFVREWRARLLFSVPGIAVFLLINLPWYFYIESQFPGWLRAWVGAEQIGHLAGSSAPATHYENVPQWQFLLLHLAWFFPWSIVAIVDGFRAVRRGGEWTREGWLCVAWAAVVVIPLLLVGERQDYYAMAGWPVFALAIAGIRDRVGLSTISNACIAAICAAGLVAAILIAPQGGSSAEVAARATAWTTILGFGPEVWSGLRWLGVFSLTLALIPLVVGGLQRRRRFAGESLAAAILAVAAIAGYSIVSPYFSLAGAAGTLNASAFNDAPVVYDGGLDTGSSLLFYTDRKVLLVDSGAKEPSDADFAEMWKSGERLAFVTEKSRVAAWEQVIGLLPEPAAVCGTQVIFQRGN